MSKRVTSIVAIAAIALAVTDTTEAFTTVPTTKTVAGIVPKTCDSFLTTRFAEETKEGGAFVPLDSTDDNDNDEDTLSTVEMLGRGAAKVKRGKRKGGSSAPTPSKAAVSLAPEEVYYEGPPAITETIIPTISILTVIGIVPAAAAWARQAWVRYKITTRRIRVTSGIGGKDMAEIVYPDIVEIRTVKRLFGDGDMVAFLRDGAKFEMRNIPNFDETIEFILKQVDPKVVAQYRDKGDVTKA